jgi:heme/copper-type cytochrome/quinol oxidase subunit 3
MCVRWGPHGPVLYSQKQNDSTLGMIAVAFLWLAATSCQAAYLHSRYTARSALALAYTYLLCLLYMLLFITEYSSL